MGIMDSENQTTDMPKEIPTGLTRSLMPRIHIIIIPMHTITRIPGTTDMDMGIIHHITLIIEIIPLIVTLAGITVEHIIPLTVEVLTIEVQSQKAIELSTGVHVLHGV